MGNNTITSPHCLASCDSSFIVLLRAGIISSNLFWWLTFVADDLSSHVVAPVTVAVQWRVAKRIFTSTWPFFSSRICRKLSVYLSISVPGSILRLPCIPIAGQYAGCVSKAVTKVLNDTSEINILTANDWYTFRFIEIELLNMHFSRINISTLRPGDAYIRS